MKFNERELAAWASTFVPDKEGLLEKRGAGISHGRSTPEIILIVCNVLPSLRCIRCSVGKGNHYVALDMHACIAVVRYFVFIN